MASKEEQQQQSAKTRQKVAKAASTVKNVATAAAKASAGDVVGAVGELLKDENIRKVIIAILLVVALLFVGIPMLVGSAITGTIEALQNGIQENWDTAWEEQGEQSSGNALFLYSDGANKAQHEAVTQAVADLIKSLFETDHEVDGKDATNNFDSGTNNQVTSEDYETTILAVTDMEALAGESGCLQRRIDMIKRRVKQRGEQLSNWAAGQYKLEALGIAIAQGLTAKMKDPLLYHGISPESSLEIDAAVFELSDIQALKVYAAYAVQHDVVLSDSDMWNLMDYCGWYSIDFEEMDTSGYKDPDNPNIYNTEAKGYFSREIGGVVQEGDELSADIYNLQDPWVPHWAGSCAPQWYYEEIAQLNAYNEKYEKAAAKEEAATGNDETVAAESSKTDQMLHFAERSDGQIDRSNFEKLGEVEPYGIIDKIYTGAKATVAISRTEYYGVDKPAAEFLANIGSDLKSLWDEAFGEQTKTTANGNLVGRDEENNHYFVVYNTDSAYCYYLINQTTGLSSATFQGTGDTISFSGLSASTQYIAYKRPAEAESDDTEDEGTSKKPNPKPSSPETTPAKANIADDTAPINAAAAKAKTGNSSAKITYVDEFTTFVSAANTKAYQLIIDVDVVFTARSIDEILYDYLGLWPGSLEETVVGDGGLEYAAGFEGNELLLKTWTDVYTDPETGEKTTITFERQQSNQAESYEDVVLAVATTLGYDINGLFAQDYGYGGTIVSMAQQELDYYNANNLSGGSRYWSIVGEAEHGNSNYYDHSQPWCVAFVNACAYQCGFLGQNGWFDGEAWPYTVSGIWNALVGSGQAVGHNTADNYVPIPGDLILFGESVGCDAPDHIGIVEYVDDDGCVHTIEGNSGNQVKRCTYENYKIGTYAWEGVVISHYINPDYPTSFLENPMYQSIETLQTPALTSRIIAADGRYLISGQPRFREEQMSQVLDELATMYPELYTEALRKAYPHNLGSCRVNGITWLIPCAYTRIASPFGMREHPIYGDYRMHNGIDLAAEEGVTIFASRKGYVSSAGYNDSMGYYVFIDHDDGYRTIYMHMVQQAEVSGGETVKAGQIIGYVGSTGDSTGPHLHYEIRLNGEAIDPAPYLGIGSAGSEESYDTADALDLSALMDAWNDLCTSGKDSRFEEAQMNIAAKLYVNPVAQEVTVSTGFNWNSTRLRQEILWGVATTSSRNAALVSVMQSLSTGLDNSISDADLINAMANGDYLVKTVTSNKDNLWPGESQAMQESWINGIQLLMIALQDTYSNITTTEVEMETIPQGE